MLQLKQVQTLRITSDGKLLVAGADSYHGDADDLVLKERSGSNVGMTKVSRWLLLAQVMVLSTGSAGSSGSQNSR